MIGSTIGHYKIESKLGEGGMFQISPRLRAETPNFGVQARTRFVSGWRFENPTQRSVGGGVI